MVHYISTYTYYGFHRFSNNVGKTRAANTFRKFNKLGFAKMAYRCDLGCNNFIWRETVVEKGPKTLSNLSLKK